MKGELRHPIGAANALRSARFARRAAWRSRDSGDEKCAARLDITRVCRVAVSRQGCVRDMLLHPEMPLDELQDCLRAIFPNVATPIALKNENNTLYPLSLLAHHPSTFSAVRKEAHTAVPLELVCLGDPDVSYTELTRPSRVGWHDDDPNAPPLELSQYTLPQLIREFSAAAPTGALDRNSFVKCLTQMTAHDDHALFSRLFDLFDKDRNGIVDVVEFVSGLSVLVQGDRDEKIRATFSLYDTNGDGFISRDEMTAYLTSVYLVVAELNPRVFETNHVDPIQLGHVTAAQCFADADVNHDGRLSFDEFRAWYTRTNDHHQPHARKLKQVATAQTDLHARQPIQVKWTLHAIRDMTGLGDFTVEEMLGWFPHANAPLTKALFLSTMQRIMQRQRKAVTPNILALLDTLFGLFDSDGNGVLNGLELKTGLSILCYPDPYGLSVRAAFDLMDTNHDGHISMNEMVRYLGSVFRILHGVTNAHVPLEPQMLARYTAQQMFAEADINHDGVISYPEFQAWFLVPTTVEPSAQPLFPQHKDMAELGRVHPPPAAPMTLEKAGALTNLSTRHPLDVFEIVALYVNADGVLTKAAFNQAFVHLMQGAPQPTHLARDVIEKLFVAFDADGDGVVDFCELSSGLSLLCAGSQQEKIEAAFTLYDVNKDNFISLSELVSYLTAVFRVIYAFGTPVAGVSPDQLADSTARDAFAQFDANRDGQLSLAEFTAWYSAPQPSAPPAPTTTPPRFDLAFLRHARQLTQLGQYAVRDIFAFFQASATHDQLSKAQFFRCFNKLLSKTDPAAETKPQLKATLDRLFVLFDTDGNGVVDTKELAAGLSLLCGGSDTDKVEAAFSLFDANGDGFISRDEMVNYLTALFKVLLQTSPHLQAQLGDATATQLALAATTHCFATCDLNHDNRLSMDEFTAWYRDPQAKHQPSQEPPPSLAHARALLGLDTMTVETLLDLFRGRRDDPIVSEKAFLACFSKFTQTEDHATKARVHALLASLYASFHAAFEPLTPALLYGDVACGLSVLTADRDVHDKVRATFRLLDRNGDMALCYDELVRYFTAVFAIMYVVEPKKQAAHVSPLELAEITAQHTLDAADTNQDNAINFVEFQRWYTQSQASPPTAMPQWSLADIRHRTALGYLDVEDVFERFADVADDDQGGAVSFDQFRSCLDTLAREYHGDASAEHDVAALASTLFGAFEVDERGRVEFSELASGLSVLCKGSRDAKVQAAFSLYDFNGDGFISVDEMVRYLTSVFRVLYVLQPDMALETGVSAHELGVITAEQAFAEADLDRDNRLSLAEFATWYAKHKPSTEKPVWNLDEIRRHTKLMYHKAEDVFELFAEAANEDGNLNQVHFDACFMKLMGDDQAYTPWVRMFLDRLFQLFDANQDGWVDFSELTAGLSILCAGSKEDKVQAAFTLFDFNGDGYISLEEMTKYLTSVFRVLFELNDQHAQTLQISPEELAHVTASQAFNDGDLNHDGKISLDEFKKWYSNPGSLASHSEHLFSLQEARRLTQLERHAPDTVFEILADSADHQGNLTKDAFTECFDTHFLSTPADARTMHVIHRLFDIFDTDGNGQVDFAELTAGLSLLCGGRREDKVRAAFALYDYNHDGVISLDEMTRYLTAVFKVLYTTNPGLEAQMQVTSAELAQVTAEQAFLECDINKDGKLTLDEFHAWYYADSMYTQAHKQPQKLSIPLPSLAQVRHLTNLSSFPPSEVVERFRQAAPSGQLSRDVFTESLKTFAKDGESAAAAIESVAARLFDLFDTDGNGVVDYAELGAGLCVLCGGSQEDKVRAAFALYDLNHDGTISRSEMALYLTSVFKVLYDSNPNTQRQMQGVTPEELGAITADQAFVEADKDHNGVLSFDEFRQWYLTPSLSKVNTVEVPAWVSLQTVKELTQLHLYPPSEVFDLLSQHMADPRGLDRPAFERCFASLIPPDALDDEGRHRLHLILDRLFNVFDTNGNGFVNYHELASGLSILCGGSRQEKVQAAFDLYDLNHDGVISFDEMVRYLTSVFKILCDTNAEAYPSDVTPLELAQVTAEQCFAQVDLKHDGKLTLEEFDRWYTQDTSESHDEVEHNEETTRAVVTSSEAAAPPSGMERIRNLLKLNKYEVGDIFEIFAEAAPNGELGFAAFRQCFEHMVELAGGYDSPQAKQEAAVVIRRLFRVFDVDQNNAVDFGELASGLSVLSGSSMDDKVLAAFRLYDLNGDGYISLDEMISYMTSIFRVMYETSDKAKKQMSVSPEELARVTATQCFKDADLNHDKKLSFDEFKQWCTSSM
ncbi:Aste57867_395 [Aphanomyces stellatus]|uniref:Aste57867_395 protein n=1 Tax=Aphanomyces stellatus TaxID=120398 RepID=A0A485K567_9STRA|nr:hypothetical protein As57867_000394 [Aphanomyces stellatus]VFT77620.1 Aste57867_395 [Aphanomyces stellatus]